MSYIKPVTEIVELEPADMVTTGDGPFHPGDKFVRCKPNDSGLVRESESTDPCTPV